ncbi:glycosyltransferase family 4 protein [Geomonas sp. Red32]|uniref:glycosyltransferase family 4 protein n=1 Tax=Geomonas sp. Red32 TaxID=2912856 RepID=UPI00202CB317|nr:glycosyltransferase family 4 protein [Geomonas sp. Red32]MCM0081187.1 glycosyltransferase family 4 protein [Geomonas sp. Red32]
MRILTIGPWFSPHTVRPINWLLEQGHEVLFLGERDPLPAAGGGYRFLPFPNLGDLPSTLGALGEIRDRFRPDAVHVHWIDHKAWLCVQAGLRPLVLSAWGSDINQFFLAGHDENQRRMIGATLAGADLTIVDAPTMADKCCQLAGRLIPTTFLHLGVDTVRFAPGYREEALAWRERLGIPADATVFLSPRGWGESNGHHLILEAFARALPAMGGNGILLFKIFNRVSFGDHLKYESELKRRVEELGIAGQVRFMEEVSAELLPQVFALSDVVVNYPSRDTLPITLAESAACGKSAISVMLPSYRGTFVERHFRTFLPGDEEELIRAMVELAEEPPQQRLAAALAAREEVRATLDEGIYRKGLPGVYAGVCAGGKAGAMLHAPDREEAPSPEPATPHLERAYRFFAGGDLAACHREVELELRVHPDSGEALALAKSVRLMSLKG